MQSQITKEDIFQEQDAGLVYSFEIMWVCLFYLYYFAVWSNQEYTAIMMGIQNPELVFIWTSLHPVTV